MSNNNSEEPIITLKGVCTVCNEFGYFSFYGGSPRESFNCSNCKSSLRYREQARVLVNLYGSNKFNSIKELSQDEDFRELKIYEPGVSGPFRKYFKEIKNYHQSFFWDNLELGEFKDGVQKQDLMNLTFENDHFDLVITSDIFEHVRKPFLGFKEVYRVLKPGGIHVFTIPLHHPMPRKTHFRVDTSGPENVYIDPPHYHGDGRGGKSLVYVDYGVDLINHLNDLGFYTYLKFVESDDRYSSVNVSFYSVKSNEPNHKLAL